MTDKELKNLKIKLITSFFIAVVVLQIFIGVLFFVLNVLLINSNIYLIILEIIVTSIFILLIANKYVSVLVRNIEDSNSRNKEFISNAAHELRTPITLIQTNIELAEKSQNYQKYLGQAKAEIRDYNEFVKKLLQLANIQKEKVALSGTIDLNEIIQDSLYSIDKQVKERNLDVIKIMHNTSVKGDDILILMLINNLLENAVKYAEQDSKIVIQSDSAGITITNKSKKIVDINKLSQRFYKERQNIPGHGIGLSIVQRIVDIHKWELKFKYENGYFKALVKY